MKKITVAFFSFASLLVNAQNVKLEVGKKINIHNKTTTISIKPDMMGGGESKSESELFATLEIVTKNEKNYTSNYKSIKATNKNEDAGNLDSDNKKDRESERGQIMFKGINETISKNIDASTGAITDLSNKNTEETSSKNEGNSTISIRVKETGNMIDNSFFVISSDKKIGDKWTVTKTEGDQKSTKNYELKSIELGVATIAFTSFISETSTKEINGMTMERNEETKGNGTITVDTNTSIVKKFINTNTTEGSIEIMGNSTVISIKRNIETTFE